MITSDTIEKYTASHTNNSFGIEQFSKFRDVFNARLETYISRTKDYLASAVIGEIGNNTFDHNYNFPLDKPKGVLFDYENDSELIVLADYGVGLRSTLSKVKHDIKSDLDAIQIAFSLQISGRAPEQRGNGLKFVRDTMIKNNWGLFFQSGTAYIKIFGSKIAFSECSKNISGCLALLQFTHGGNSK